MDDEKLKIRIGANISAYRKGAHMTQADLAEKLNYSDKAVSKWERGESVPDVLTMVQLADQFGVTVNDLLIDPNALPEETTKFQQAMEQVSEKALKRKADKRIVQMLSSVLVWFVALFVFVLVSSLGVPKSWLAFFVAIPANAIVLLSMRSAWHDYRMNQLLISVIVWGCLLSVYMIVLVLAQVNLWKIFLLGIPGQFAVFLWFRMFRPSREKQTMEEEIHE